MRFNFKSLYSALTEKKNKNEEEIHKKTDNGVYQVLVEAVEDWKLQKTE